MSSYLHHDNSCTTAAIRIVVKHVCQLTCHTLFAVEALTAQYVKNRWAITWDARPNDNGTIQLEFAEQLRGLSSVAGLQGGG
jgi:hypothetical protein